MLELTEPLPRCCLLVAGSVVLALSGSGAWAQRAIHCDSQCIALPDYAPQIRCSNEITIRQEPTSYQVTIGDQSPETSVIFETQDRRKVVLSASKRLSDNEAGVLIVTVDFQNPKVERYAPPLPGAGALLSQQDLLWLSPILAYRGCIRLD
jgi:hypothetical protein